MRTGTHLLTGVGRATLIASRGRAASWRRREWGREGEEGGQRRTEKGIRRGGASKPSKDTVDKDASGWAGEDVERKRQQYESDSEGSRFGYVSSGPFSGGPACGWVGLLLAGRRFARLEARKFGVRLTGAGAVGKSDLVQSGCQLECRTYSVCGKEKQTNK
jgi:hypothetical protein